MYLIDKQQNRIKNLTKKKFSDLGFRERQHLQEWLANKPDAFGEELLIIQKEFDGFSDTNERLDLLALDKRGNIVVIENKLDDTGRDVTWQGVKYASYCSTLNKENIRTIFQAYLDKQGQNEDAVQKLSDFYNQEYDEISLNQGQTQRIILVAAHFRKEVTSSVLWLLSYKVRLQCFKVTPFALDEQLFLTLEQIIPTKDTEEFVISMADKTQEEINTQEGLKDRHLLRTEFWGKVLPSFKGKTTSIFQNVNPTKDHWLSSGGAGMSGVRYTMTITKNNASVVLEFAKPDKEENKRLFEELLKYQTEIENAFGHSLNWEKLENNISSRISYTLPNVNIFNKGDWDKISNFLSSNMIKLEQVLRQPLAQIKQLTSTIDEAGPDY